MLFAPSRRRLGRSGSTADGTPRTTPSGGLSGSEQSRSLSLRARTVARRAWFAGIRQDCWPHQGLTRAATDSPKWLPGAGPSKETDGDVGTPWAFPK